MANWKDVIVGPQTPLEQVIACIDKSALQCAVVVNENGSLAGMVTDGDIRRAILRRASLQTPIEQVMNPAPTSVAATMDRDEMLALMRRRAFHHLPLVDGAGRVVGLATLDQLLGAVERPNWIVLMAGGLGTRLRPLTEDLPKPLLPVGGKPVLENIVESFAEQGFRRIFVAVNYKAEMIRQYFGSGERWGVQMHYLDEQQPLGTAGALSLLPEQPTEPMIVMNGDLLTRTNFANLLQFHATHAACATMAVREYGQQVPYGVLTLDGTRICSIEEKPITKHFVSAGIYALAPEALEFVTAETFLDMPTLFGRLIAARRTTAAYPLREYWVDIGRLEELERAQREWVRETR
jgi:dTDP-glucose pyrophosphorylase